MTWRRELLVVIGGNLLCVALLSVGTFLILRVTPAGSLLSESWGVRHDPAALSEVVDAYPEPLRLLTDVVPFWLTILGGAVSLLVGGVVGWLTSARAWLPLVAVAPLTASPLLIDVYAADVWLRAVLWGLLAWLAAAVVRWRRARRRERA